MRCMLALGLSSVGWGRFSSVTEHLKSAPHSHMPSTVQEKKMHQFLVLFLMVLL